MAESTVLTGMLYILCLQGGDDQRVLVWKVADAIQGRDKLAPVCMTSKHRSNIFTIDFSCDNSFVFSGGEQSNET